MNSAKPHDLGLQYTKQRKNLHCAFYLCNIPDAYHALMMMVAGIDSIEVFATTNQHAWKDLASTFPKLKPKPFYLNLQQLKKLAALSLWARVKIVYGEESDYDGLSTSDVAAFVKSEICQVKSYKEEKPLDLTEIVSLTSGTKPS